MTLGYIKSEIFNLGFEKSQKYKDDRNIIIQAINRAVDTITTEVRPIMGELVLEQRETGFFDMVELTRDENGVRFLGLCELEDVERNRLADYELRRNRVLVLPEGTQYPVMVYYRRAYTPVTADTPEDTPTELDPDVCELLPLLAAFYVWLDEGNGVLSSYYKNEYERKCSAILGRDSSAVATVLGGDYLW